MAGGLSIARAGPPDAAALAGLHGAIFPDPWSAPAMDALLGEPTTRAWLARAGDPTCRPAPPPDGFLLARIVLDEAEILSIGVAERCRKRGIGGALLAALHAECRRHGVRRIILEVGVGNAAARALYAQGGYRPAGRRAGYYARDGMTEDAILLVRTVGEDGG